MKLRLTTFFALFISMSLMAQIPQAEQKALEELYHQTNGAQWNQTWDLSLDASDLPGVTVENGHVTEIRMLFNNLSGTIPATIGHLKELKVLELSFNKLQGALPTTLGDLTKLEVLALNGNNLKGNIPTTISKLSKLRQLHVSSNQLNGEIPADFVRLSQLEVFNVFDNNLKGALPVGLAKNRNIREFMVAENNFENTNEISNILLSNSGQVNLQNNIFNPSGKSIIAIESSDDEN
ncbi:MAG: hypothetical protein HKN48_07770 [Flavobacteriaceae bacterium]|nr:hypothetical protein [Flavobacteriaceae bacterium]